MKHSKLVRVAALVAVTSLVASCGSSSESSDTTERTRNAAIPWTPSTTPTKILVYGTQDGHIEAITVGSDPTDEPQSIATIEPSRSWGNSIASIAVDTARSELIVLGADKNDNAHLSKMNLDGTGYQDVYTSAGQFGIAMSYDPGSRVAVFFHSVSGSGQYVVHSVDEVSSPLVSSPYPAFGIPAYDGASLYVSTSEHIGKANAIAFDSFTSLSASVGTPRDLWSIAKDTKSAKFFGGRDSSNSVMSIDVSGAGNTRVGTVTSPASMAVFSSGQIVVGTGRQPYSHSRTTGGISLVDPTGATSTLTVKNFGLGGSTAGVQSLWAVESPIASSAPAVKTLSLGLLSCTDATWKGDLPLSRLSRSPITSVRSYAWFKDGVRIMDASGETLVVEELGTYSCAVMAANFAGSGNSPQSAGVKVVSLPTTTVEATTTTEESTTTTSSIVVDGGSDSTTPTSSVGGSTSTTLGSTGGSESSAGASPVVTVPTLSPGTPIVIATPTLKSVKWTFKGRTAKVTFKKWSGASKYRLSIAGATKKTVTCKTVKTTVTCTATLKKGINSFSAKAMSRSGITLALSTKTRNIK